MKIGVSIDDYVFENWKSELRLISAVNAKKYAKHVENMGHLDSIVLKAEKICNRVFNLLGSGDYEFEREIKWNVDFKSGFAWENEFYKDIKTIDLTNNADVKVPWELSRFQHLTVLGQAYWITGKEKYSEEFEHQITHWIQNNPVECSVNWTCAMDVAIRACNWIVGYMYFNDSLIPNEFWMMFNKSLFFHGDFIYNNLEKGYPSNNHYMSNLVGLVWIGLYFKNLNYKSKKINKWLCFALNELEIEIENQVYDDGFNFEASTAYHCLTTELLLYTSILCSKNNVSFSEHFEAKLEQMCEVIMNITKPNGLIPLIGDMDSGRFIMFSSYGDEEKRDFRYLIEVAGEHFDRDDFKCHVLSRSTAVCLFSEFDSLKASYKPLSSVAYYEGGVHILRNSEVYLAIRCGQNGTAGKGGHTHNDQLSFELNVNGEDFIIDPGTYVYTSDFRMRNLFRSTVYHNTLAIVDLEQNDYFANNLFHMQDQTNARVISFDKGSFCGEHYGYIRHTGLIHQRSVKLEKESIIICDRLVPGAEKFEKNVNSKINFIFDVDVDLIEERGRIIADKNNVRVEIAINSGYVMSKVFVANQYGVLKESNRLEVTVQDEISEIWINY